MTRRERDSTENDVFRPSRLTVARQRRGMTKTDLSHVAQLSVNSLSSYENEKTTPRRESVEQIAQALRFPVSFFYGTDVPLVEADAVSFRALSRMPAQQRDMVTSTAALATVLDGLVDQIVDRPAIAVLDLAPLGPVEAAEAVRAEWGLGAEPIPDLVALLEARGVRIYSLGLELARQEVRGIDALSMWWDETPYIFLNTDATTERVRFNLAHELGHLILHREAGTTGKAAEKEANAFAGHLLVPSDGIRAEAFRTASFDEILTLKKRWKVSAMAYVYRMNDEGILDEWRYRELMIRLRRDYGSTEPEPIEHHEFPTLLREALAKLGAGSGRRALADRLNIPVTDLDDMIFRHTLTPVAGAGDSGEPGGLDSPPNLSVVK